jgi:hypothetical protein
MHVLPLPYFAEARICWLLPNARLPRRGGGRRRLELLAAGGGGASPLHSTSRLHSTSTSRSGLLQGTDAREEGLLELHLLVELPRQCICPGPLSVCSLHFGRDPQLRHCELDPLVLRVLLSS